MATDAVVRQRSRRSSLAQRISVPEWPAPAWGAIGVTTLFIAITSWWLSRDRSIPVFDAGLHLTLSLQVYKDLGAGHLGEALTQSVPYPPFAYLVASLGLLTGGVAVAPPIIAENLVFLSLLALGCYKVARIAFGPTAGLLAVVFALGSPLIIAQFHVFMTDAPETGMVAVSVWLIIATEGFSRMRNCAVAGVAVGLGMLTKEPFAIFVLGIVGVTIWRGGRQCWRGFAVFSAIALVIALPWYIAEWGQIVTIGNEASSPAGNFAQYRIAEVAPPRLSLTNLSWYMWSIINSQLYLPLFLFAAIGWLWTLAGFARRRLVSPLAIELVAGSFIGWLLLTETFIHDERYDMPLLIYLAVFGAGWIVRLPGRARFAVAGLLALVALANTLGGTFGVGAQARVVLPGAPANTLQQPGTLTIYNDTGFLVGAPERDGDLLQVLRALHREGITGIRWTSNERPEPDFSEGGLGALATIAGLELIPEAVTLKMLDKHDAYLARGSVGRHEPPPCIRLSDGIGVWVRIGNPKAKGVKDYCPIPRPHFYG
jgi:hypothetical protein